MIRLSLVLLSLGLLCASIGCHGDGEVRGERHGALEQSVLDRDAGRRTQLERESGAPGEAPALVATLQRTDFMENAFPPGMPGDESHSGAWLRKDCLLCHEGGRKGAPIVRHAGMTRLLLRAQCRSCHLPLPFEGRDIAAHAFPPTLPHDEAHSGGWLRKDCLHCHEKGLRDAPPVKHAGMSKALLAAQCRSCHVPSVPSELADVSSDLTR